MIRPKPRGSRKSPSGFSARRRSSAPAEQPRRLLLYRSPERVKASKLNGGDLFGADRQFVAYGRHSDGSSYGWRGASPATAKAADVPLLLPGRLPAFLEAMGVRPADTRGHHPSSGHGARRRHRQGLPDVIAAGGIGELPRIRLSPRPRRRPRAGHHRVQWVPGGA